MHFDFDRPLKLRRIAGKTLAQSPVQFRIAGLPQLVTDVNAREINVAVAKTQSSSVRFSRVSGLRTLSHLHTLVRLPLFPPVCRHRTPRRRRVSTGLRAGRTPSRKHLRDFAEKDAAFFPKARVDELLIVSAAEPAGVQAARKGHLHVVLLRVEGRGRESRFALDSAFLRTSATPNPARQRLPVNPRDVGDVFRGFEPAFDFQRSDAGADQFRQNLQPGQILRAEQIFPVAERNRFAVGNQIVGHPAGLRTFAAIGRASAERFAGKALAGIGDTERAMDENFQGKSVECQSRGQVIRGIRSRSRHSNIRPNFLNFLAMEHSRASTTRLQPSSRANSTPAALVMVIWVEA